MGGSLGRREATGRGVFVTGREAAAKRGVAIQGARIAIQGFGNVGGIAANMFAEAGSKIIAVQDHTGTVVHQDGLNVAELHKHVAETGGVAGFPGAEATQDRDSFWGIESDILVPAALEQQITAKNAGQIRTKIILEGANGPTTPEADDILNEKDILIVPDVLCNAGGVTVSYFEWVQDFSSFFWSEEEINARLTRIMQDAFNSVWEVSQEKKVSLRTATFILACTRVLAAREVRGLYP